MAVIRTLRPCESKKRLHKDTAQFAKLSTMSLETYLKTIPGMVNTGATWHMKMAFGLSVPLQFRLNGEIMIGTGPLNLYTVRDIEYIHMELMQAPPFGLPYLPIMTSPDYPCRFEIYLKEDAKGPVVSDCTEQWDIYLEPSSIIRFTTLRSDWRIKPRIAGRRSIGSPTYGSGTTARVRSSFTPTTKTSLVWKS